MFRSYRLGETSRYVRLPENLSLTSIEEMKIQQTKNLHRAILADDIEAIKSSLRNGAEPFKKIENKTAVNLYIDAWIKKIKATNCFAAEKDEKGKLISEKIKASVANALEDYFASLKNFNLYELGILYIHDHELSFSALSEILFQESLSKENFLALIEKFLKDRWDRVMNTDQAVFYQASKLSLLCIELANLVLIEEQKKPNPRCLGQILQPTITLIKDTLDQYGDLAELNPFSYIVSTDGTTPLPIAILSDRFKLGIDGLANVNPYNYPEKITVLDQQRLIYFCKESQMLAESYEKLLASNAENELVKEIKNLIEGLKEGGMSRNGTDQNAGPEAFAAINHFAVYFNKLTEESPILSKQLLSLVSSTDYQTTFGQVWDMLLDKNRSMLNCVEQGALFLEGILNNANNRDFFYPNKEHLNELYEHNLRQFNLVSNGEAERIKPLRAFDSLEKFSQHYNSNNKTNKVVSAWHFESLSRRSFLLCDLIKMTQFKFGYYNFKPKTLLSLFIMTHTICEFKSLPDSVKKCIFQYRDQNFDNILHCAAREKNVEWLSYLLSEEVLSQCKLHKGSNINLLSPFQVAINSKNSIVIDLFLKAEVELAHIRHSGMREALIVLIKDNQTFLIKKLIKHIEDNNIDVNWRTNNLENPLKLALRSEDHAIFQIIFPYFYKELASGSFLYSDAINEAIQNSNWWATAKLVTADRSLDLDCLSPKIHLLVLDAMLYRQFAKYKNTNSSEVQSMGNIRKYISALLAKDNSSEEIIKAILGYLYLESKKIEDLYKQSFIDRLFSNGSQFTIRLNAVIANFKDYLEFHGVVINENKDVLIENISANYLEASKYSQ